ncbi:MAG: hypothetical protein L0Y71_24410 [Gemmataceae bacterium]|nr:hypothetical protein [Gemmataceae bacterium]
MRLLKPLGRWTARTLKALTLSAAILGTTAAATAQSSSFKQAAARTPPGMPKLIYTKSNEFKLPIQMDDKTRAGLERVCLYVKSGNADWVRQEVGPPTMPHFTYRVPQDGEYCFSLATIDKTGKMSPADIGLEPPALRVLVDTKAPMLDVQPWTSPEGELCLRCNIVDTHPDHTSVKMVAKLPGGDRPLASHSSQPGAFVARGGPEILSASIVVTAHDLSGNQTTREVRLRDLMASQVAAAPAMQSPVTPGPVMPSQFTPNPPPASVSNRIELPPARHVDVPQPPMLPMPAFPDSTHVSLPPAPPIAPVTSSPVSPSPVSPNSVGPRIETGTPNLRLPIEPSRQGPTINQAPMPSHMPPPVRTPVVGADAAATAAKQVINTPRAIVDYRIDQVGPSGVGRVEVFMTSDQGQSWQKIGVDADRRSPIEFDLPGEGVFGIRLVVTNGNGFGGAAPQRGESPTYWIDVDTSAPFVQLRPIEPIIANGTLEIRWQATDKNLGAEPISLYYRSRSDAAWRPVARHVKNEGLYRWTFPREAAPQFFVKIEVTDLAGNTARVETPNPVVLDTSEPRATVVGVTGLSVRPAGNP